MPKIRPFTTIDISAPGWSWPQLRPSFFGYGITPAHFPSDDLSRATFETGGSWIYVFKGRFFVKRGPYTHEVPAGHALFFSNPTNAILVYPEDVTRLTVGFYGRPTAQTAEWLITRYGSLHRIARKAPVVSHALKLFQDAERQSARSAHAWSTRMYKWLVLLMGELERQGAVSTPPFTVTSDSRLLGMSYPSFKSFAHAMGYDPAYLSRSLEKSWNHRSPAKLLRLGRLRKAEELLRTSNLSIREISREVCYSGPDAFAAAFRQVYGVPPLRYRHSHRLGLENKSEAFSADSGSR